MVGTVYCAVLYCTVHMWSGAVADTRPATSQNHDVLCCTRPHCMYNFTLYSRYYTGKSGHTSMFLKGIQSVENVWGLTIVCSFVKWMVDIIKVHLFTNILRCSAKYFFSLFAYDRVFARNIFILQFGA